MISKVSPSSNLEKKHILGLDLVRFTAAFLVMFFHLAFWSWWESSSGPGTIHKTFPDLPQYWSFTQFSWFGWVGVQIFFVISGFVIAMSATGRTWRVFATARLLRIYPTAWLSTIVIFPFYLIYSDSDISAKILRFANTLVISPFPTWLDGVFWTLVVELVFYALITVVIATRGSEKIPSVAWAMTIASSLFLSLVYFGILSFSWPTTILLLQHGTLFSLGIAMYLLLHTDSHDSRGNLALVIVSFVFSYFEIWLTATDKLYSFTYEATPAPPMIVWTFCVGVIFASAKYQIWLSAALSKFNRMIRTLGLMTYPLYLTHSLIGGAALSILTAAGLNPYLALSCAMSLCLCTAWMVIKVEQALTLKLFRPMRKNRLQ